MTFDSFIESTPAERNDYASALRTAIAALKSDNAAKGYIVTPADLKRTTEYNVGGCFKGMVKTLNGTSHKSTYRIVKGKSDGTPCVAVVKIS